MAVKSVAHWHFLCDLKPETCKVTVFLTVGQRGIKAIHKQHSELHLEATLANTALECQILRADLQAAQIHAYGPTCPDVNCPIYEQSSGIVI